MLQPSNTVHSPPRGAFSDAGAAPLAPARDERWRGPASPSEWSFRPDMRALLRRVAACEQASALILRKNGRASEARRAEVFASRIRLTLDHPQAVGRMHEFSDSAHRSSHRRVLLERALEGAISLLGADLGNIQIRDPVHGTLTIAAEHGFKREVLQYFAVVDDDSTAGGRAAKRRSQMIIVDVDDEPAFAADRSIAAAAGFRAVLSTPLVQPNGRVSGVISTHFLRSHRPSDRDLEIMEWYGELIAAALQAQQSAPTLLYEATADRHEQTADRHEAVASRMEARALSDAICGDELAAVRLRQFASLVHERALRERDRGRSRRLRVRGMRLTLEKAPAGQSLA